jgi:hypothetical protein
VHREKPLYVNLKADGMMLAIYNVERRTGLTLDTESILQEITQCLVDYSTAKIELEMFGLDMLEKNSNTYNERDTLDIINLFVKTGLQIFDEIVHYGLYKDHRLQFVYSSHFMDNVVFMEKKSMIKLLHEEFNVPTHRSERLVRSSWVPQFLP